MSHQQTRTLDELLRQWEHRADVAEVLQQPQLARLLRQIIDDVRESAAEYLTWLSEADARARSGRSVRWLRQRFPEWEVMGHARLERGRRWYRALIVPTSIERQRALRQMKRRTTPPRSAKERALAVVAARMAQQRVTS